MITARLIGAAKSMTPGKPMTSFFISKPSDRQRVHIAIDKAELPLKVTLRKGGKDRSLEQNRLMWLWMQEAADQLKEDDATGYQAYCKLHFGVPILRGEDEGFREAYDSVIRPLTYEQKIKAMKPPLSLPVTSIMKSGQLKRFLDDVYAHFRAQGVWLTEPDE